MPFADLYDAVQRIEGRVSTITLTTLAIEHSQINGVTQVWSNQFDQQILRGCYIEGPGEWRCVEIPENEALILLSRDMCTAKPLGKHWRRFIYTKELMHVFDTAEEKADSEERFDVQMQKFADPTNEMNPQFRAEAKAFWRAFMALCPEATRKEMKAKLDAEDVPLDYVAAALHLPVAYVHHLFQDNFEEIAGHLKGG